MKTTAKGNRILSAGLFWGILLVGLLLPWTVGVWVKISLQAKGMPTFPWLYFLAPGRILGEAIVSAYWALPFTGLAFLGRYGLEPGFPFSTSVPTTGLPASSFPASWASGAPCLYSTTSSLSFTLSCSSIPGSSVTEGTWFSPFWRGGSRSVSRKGSFTWIEAVPPPILCGRDILASGFSTRGLVTVYDSSGQSDRR